MKRISIILLAALCASCAATDTGDADVDARNKARNVALARSLLTTAKIVAEKRIEAIEDESDRELAVIALDAVYKTASGAIDDYEKNGTITADVVFERLAFEAIGALAKIAAESEAPG